MNIYKINKINKTLFFPEFSRSIVPAGPCRPVRSGSGAAGISAGVCGREATPSAVHHHLRGQCHQGNTPAGKRHGNKYKRGTGALIVDVDDIEIIISDSGQETFKK